MFKTNRLMLLVDEEGVLVHWNGKEITFLVEAWGAIDLLKELSQKINTNHSKPINFINIDMADIDICEEAWSLLYSVKQFTQIEELAFINKDWKQLEQLFLQRIEDDNEF